MYLLSLIQSDSRLLGFQPGLEFRDAISQAREVLGHGINPLMGTTEEGIDELAEIEAPGLDR